MKNAINAYGLPTTPTEPPLRSVTTQAGSTIFAFVAAFSLFGAAAPLERAAIAPGELVVEGKRRVIQNLEGGIIAELAVADNDFVKAGQLLLRLDSTQTSAVVAATMMERANLLIENARLEAERSGATDFDIPETLRDVADRPRIADILGVQRNLFQTRHATFHSRRDVYSERIAQGEAETRGLQSQLASERQQARLLRSERDAVKELVDLQLERRTRLLAIDRQIASVDGRIGELEAAIARTQQGIAEAKAELVTHESGWLDQVVTRQQEVRQRLRVIEEELRAQDDRNVRREIRSPVDGQVVNLRHSSVGAVVAAGEPILEVSPESEQLIVHAYLDPSDIENVHPGLETTTHLLPYSGRRVPRLSGSVTSIAQDALRDDATGRSYYLMTVHIDDHENLSKYDVDLISGMPAEVFVNLGPRSLFSYLFDPITNSFYRAFRED